jgi:hypothetical protein
MQPLRCSSILCEHHYCIIKSVVIETESQGYVLLLEMKSCFLRIQNKTKHNSQSDTNFVYESQK